MPGDCYEDVEEVINALQVYVWIWAQHGSRPKATQIRVFRDEKKLSTLNTFMVGATATERQSPTSVLELRTGWARRSRRQLESPQSL